MLQIQAIYFDSIRCYASYASYCVTINKGVFPGKIISDRRKNLGCGQKKQKALALLGLASGPLPNAVNSSVVPTEFAESMYGRGGGGGEWAYADVTTKISRIDRLPNLLSDGGPLSIRVRKTTHVI